MAKGHTFRQSDRYPGDFRPAPPETWWKQYDRTFYGKGLIEVPKDQPFKPGFPGRFSEGRPKEQDLPEEGFSTHRPFGEKVSSRPGADRQTRYWTNYGSDDAKYGWHTMEEIQDQIQRDGIPTEQNLFLGPEGAQRFQEWYDKGLEDKRGQTYAPMSDLSGEEGSDTLLGKGGKLKSGKVSTTTAYKAFGGSLLGRGYKNDVAQVKQWQQFLSDHGYYSGKIDGSFGPRTKAATMALQSDAGIKGKEVDGIVGPQTRHLAATMAQRSVADIRGKENFAPLPSADEGPPEPDVSESVSGPGRRFSNAPRTTDVGRSASSGPERRFSNAPFFPSDELTVIRALPDKTITTTVEPTTPLPSPAEPLEARTRFDEEFQMPLAAIGDTLTEGEIKRAGKATTPSDVLTPFDTIDKTKEQSRLPSMSPDASTGGAGEVPRMTPAPPGSPQFGPTRGEDTGPAPGTVPATGRISSLPIPSAGTGAGSAPPLPDISTPTSPETPLSKGSAGFDETFGGSDVSTPDLGQILSLSGGPSPTTTTAEGAVPGTDIGGLISSASQADLASQAINATPETTSPSSAPPTTSTTPSTTIAPATGRQSGLTPAQLGQLIAQATQGMSGDEARANAYSSAYG
jgi:hypothetical protein